MDPTDLRYVSDMAPGIRRRRAGRGFVYTDSAGDRVEDEAVLSRIRALAVPPAWTDVWICPTPRGHLQATGRDARGRKQYRYHPKWRRHREESKFERMAAFGKALPAIRGKTARDLRKRGIPAERALAAVVDLLDRTLIRVGNEEYVRENGTFGLTTLRDRHVRVDGSAVRFSFRGKGGRDHTVDVRDRALARLVARMQDLPGHQLFQYLNGDGSPHPICSDDVNDYLRGAAGDSFSAKDYRTWGASVHVLETLLAAGPAASAAEADASVAAAIRSAAERLGNTPRITRQSYVHPAVLDAYMNGSLADAWARAARPSRRGTARRGTARLTHAEAALRLVLSRMASPPRSGRSSRAA
jgi:DNA topoisomerase I